MQLKHFLPILIFIPLTLLQITVIPMVSIGHVVPDLIIILLIYFTLQNGQLYGTILGCILGFLFDIFSGGMVGSSMFSKTLTGFVGGYFYNENKIEHNVGTLMFVLIIFICSTLDAMVYSILAYSGTGVNFMFLMFEMSILPGIYTAVVTFPFLIFKSKKVLL
ncbi:MAG: rod shape-determining protein MreD [Ignavibacteria bacterium RBG_13_36_8]|nr:MAG: rod shape-determining protein MreD [Ignavibacteria bacterium RBG_13_36_8]